MAVHVRSAWNAFGDGASSPLLVCTRWWLICSALRRAIAPEEALAVHIVIASPLLEVVPDAWRPPLGQHFVELATRSPQDIVLTYAAVYAELFKHASGVALPVVPPLCLYVGNTTYDAAGSALNPAILVARTQYTGSLQGICFGHALRYLARLQLPAWSVTVSRWDDHASRLGYEQMAAFSAAVFVPAQLQQMMFSDLYALRVPLFVPDARLWVRLYTAEVDVQRHPRWEHHETDAAAGNDTDFRLGSAWSNAALPGLAPSAADARLLVDAAAGMAASRSHFFADEAMAQVDGQGNTWVSLDLSCNSPEMISAWFWISDYANYPGVRTFGSISALLRDVSSADLHSVSEEMARFHASMRERNRQLWTGVLNAWAG
eukprot:TRINITY_DN18510_c0_g1_i2.p1 TRINITY_DN18510_c0_g1~~TRINITY_DN18510_c0_g1_i2.p1  ORF type:complete len:375 (+),score=83.24 TRINITY_DN18510_c0_g1_i2:3-1127(+)